MPTANEAWLDAIIRHQVGLMRLTPGIQRQVSSLLNSSEKDIAAQIASRAERGMGTARLDNLLKSIQAVRSESWKDVNSHWAGQMRELAKAEPGFLDQTLHAVSPATLDITLPTAKRMAEIAKATPFEGRVLSDWAQRTQKMDIDRIEQSIKQGLIQGKTGPEIARGIIGSVQMKGTDGLTQVTRNNANAITRTGVNAISNAAKQEFYQENAELFSGEMFLATLDSRTTLLCASLDHKRFKVGEGPIPPLHWSCRSLRLALIDGQVIGDRPMRNFTKQQLLDEYAAKNGFKAPTSRDDLPKGHKTSFDTFARARMRELTGTVPATTSYHDWLKGQSPEFQDRVLGKARGKLFREDGVTLDKFVNRNGDTITLKQLRNIDREELGRIHEVPPERPLPIPKPDRDRMERERIAIEAEKQAERDANRDIKRQQDALKQLEVAKAELARVQAELAAIKAAAPKEVTELARSKGTKSVITSGVTKGEQAAVARGLQKAGFGAPGIPVMRTLRITDIIGDRSTFENQLPDMVGGMYHPDMKMLTVSTNRQTNKGFLYARNINEVAIGTDLYNTQNIAKTYEEVVEMTTVHEYGHHIHMSYLGRERIEASDGVIFKAFKNNPDFVSRYAMEDHFEYFAESFTAYKYYPRSWMERNAPKSLAMVEEVLRIKGLL